MPFTEKNIRADIETMLEFRRKGYMEVPVLEGPGFVVQDAMDEPTLAALLRAHGYLP